MSKNSKDAYGALGQSNVLFFDPESLVLVTDEKSALYDPRVNLPLSERMVLNIMHHGVVQPITISENELRDNDTPLGRAHKMQRMMQQHGSTPSDLAVLFGCSTQTVSNNLRLLECCVAVRNAVEAGKITVAAAHKLADLEPGEQKAKLAAMLKAGEGKNGHERSRKMAKVLDEAAPIKVRMRSRKQVTEALTRTDGTALAALAWVMGGTDEGFMSAPPIPIQE